MDLGSAAPPVRILHLSDIHSRADKAWDSDPVLRSLARYIGDEVRQGLVPDLVIITGDLAFSGKPEEYALVREWLEGEVWHALSSEPGQPLPRDRLLLVPGNHDVDLGLVSHGTRSMQGDLLAQGSQDAIAAMLQDEGDRALLLKRHAAYLRFYADWLGEPQPLPWWHRSIPIRTQCLHVAGLDSAWLAMGGKQDYGHLLLGQFQVHQTVAVREAKGADWRLALLHHPWDHIAPFDSAKAREAIHLHRDLVLRGHLHELEAFRVVPPDPKRACLALAAGCVYAGSNYPNAFQWVELLPSPKRVRVLFRAWVKGAWQVDRNQPGCPDGEVTFDLDVPQPKASGKPPEPSPADPRRYLEDLWSDTAHIDIRGLVTGRPDAHRFPIEELYIELQATGALRESDAAGERREHTEALDGRPDTPLRQALDNPRLVIIGDPGCGKTTFLRWVAHCLAADRLGRDPGGAARHLGLAPGQMEPACPSWSPSPTGSPSSKRPRPRTPGRPWTKGPTGSPPIWVPAPRTPTKA